MTEVSWLRCEISDGMFSDEVIVTARSVGGEDVAVFVPRSAVRDERVSVRAFPRDGDTIAILPDESRTVVAVSPSHLHPA